MLLVKDGNTLHSVPVNQIHPLSPSVTSDDSGAASTARAVAEVNDSVATVRAAADVAIATAQQSLTIANEAGTIATGALTKANGAPSIVSTAATTANGALTSANALSTTTATNTANNAQTTANAKVAKPTSSTWVVRTDGKLPSGGTWAYYGISYASHSATFYNSCTFYSGDKYTSSYCGTGGSSSVSALYSLGFKAGVAAGGTSIGTPYMFCWKVA